MSQDSDVARQYWRKNLKIISLLLTIWAVVSLGFGIALAPWLNQYQLPGTEFPLGFWFAQQGWDGPGATCCWHCCWRRI